MNRVATDNHTEGDNRIKFSVFEQQLRGAGQFIGAGHANEHDFFLLHAGLFQVGVNLFHQGIHQLGIVARGHDADGKRGAINGQMLGSGETHEKEWRKVCAQGRAPEQLISLRLKPSPRSLGRSRQDPRLCASSWRATGSYSIRAPPGFARRCRNHGNPCADRHRRDASQSA